MNLSIDPKQHVFIDTSFLVALYNKKDTLHEKAKLYTGDLEKVHVVISNFILLESYTILSQRASKQQAISFGNYVRKYNPYDIFWIERELENEVWRTFTSIKDKNFSYVDASILTVIQKEGISHLLSFDHAFKRLEKEYSFNLIEI